VSDIAPTQLTREVFERGGVQVGDRPAAPAIVIPFGRNVRDKAYFEAVIAGEWRKQVSGIVQVGKYMNQAHEELSEYDFNTMRLPVGKRAVQKIRRIANNPVMSDSANHGSLPGCWRTLDDLLTVADDSLLKVAIADGRIHPELERKDVRRALGLPPRPTRGGGSKGNGQTREKPRDAVVMWAGFSTEDKRAILDSEGRVGLAKLLSPELMRDLVRHLIPLQEEQKRGRR
jgi:hypothetical protein